MNRDPVKGLQMRTYDQLASAQPPYSAWDIFGRDDELGTINLLTPERVAAAAQLVRTGRRFSLDYPVNAFQPFPTAPRPATRHQVFELGEFARDDWLDSFYLQSTSQIDGLRHIGHPVYGFYNGLSAADNSGASTRLGIHNWAESGIAGRGVLLDVVRFFAEQGREYDREATVLLDATTLDEIAAAQGVEWHGGDMLLLRTGWAESYLSKTEPQRVDFSYRAKSPGLARREAVVRWLWDKQIALVASDTPAVEAQPVLESDFRAPGRLQSGSVILHQPLIALLGMAMGELWNLEDLAADCAQDGRYDFFLTAKPLNIPGGVGSPPNAMAFK
ncbi:cyclase family protein [Actinoplanes sp. NPDC049681]|uniref:cyclase family protein n=1 Tax=Actinoplanes sp. NPDC049681 TaxID=3363905 RepID=UPI0037B812B1